MKRIVAAVLTIVMALSMLSASLYLQADELTFNADNLNEDGVVISDGMPIENDVTFTDDCDLLQADDSVSFNNGDDLSSSDDIFDDAGDTLLADEIPNADEDPNNEASYDGSITSSDDVADNGSIYGEPSLDDGWYDINDSLQLYANGVYSDDLQGAVITIMIMVDGNWVEYKKGEADKYPKDAQIQVILHWEFDDDDIIQDMEIDVGDLILDKDYSSPTSFVDQGHPLDDGTYAKAGEYYVSNEKLYIEFENEFANPSDGTLRQNRKVEFVFTGTLDMIEEDMPDGSDQEVKIFEQDVTVKPDYKESSLEPAKNMSDIELDENGNYISHVTLTFTAKEGIVKDFKFFDTFTGNMELSGNVTWELNPKRQEGDKQFNMTISTDNDGLPDVNGNYGRGLHGVSDAESFLRPGDVVTVKYDVIIPSDVVEQVVKDGIIINKVKSHYDNNKDKEDEPETGTSPGLNGGRIEKSGAWREDEATGKNYIDWNIAYTTGVDISWILDDTTLSVQEKLKKIEDLGIDPYVIDYLPEGLTPVLPDNWQELGYVWDANSRELKIPLTEFRLANEHWRVIYDYNLTTEVAKGYEDATFKNTVKTTEFGKEITGSSGDVKKPGEGGGIHKKHIGTLVRNSDGTYSMLWEITITVPDEDFNQYTFKDSPVEPKLNGQNSSDRRVESIVLTRSSIDPASIPDGAIDYSQMHNGEVKINGSQQNPAYAVLKGQTLTFTVTTTYDFTGNGGYFNGEVELKNTVDGNFGYDEDTYTETLEYSSSFTKSVVKDGTTDIDVQWEIKPSKPITEYIDGNLKGLIFGDNGLDIDITDIPQGMELLEGSLEIYLYGLSDKADNYVRNASLNFAELEKSIYEAIESRLTIQRDDSGNIKIKSSDGEGLKKIIEQIYNTPLHFSGYDSSFNSEFPQVFLGIRYKTRITDINDVLNNPNGVAYVNKASGEVNNEHGEDEARSEVRVPDNKQMESVLDKSYVYSSNEYDYPSDEYEFLVTNPDGHTPNIYFSIDINRYSYKLNNGNELKVVDTLGSSLDIILRSLKVISVDEIDEKGLPRLLEEGVDYTFTIDDKKGAPSTLTFHVPDEKHIRITYWASITYKNDAGELDYDTASNSVSLWGNNNTEINDKTQNPSERASIEAWASSENYTLDVFKYTTADGDPDGDKIGLKGAEFELIPGAFADWNNGDGNYRPDAEFIPGYFVTADGKKEFIEQTLDEVASRRSTGKALNGIIATFVVGTSEATPDSDTLYMLVETKAPDNYKRSGEPIYIYFGKCEGERLEYLRDTRNVIFVENYTEVSVYNEPAASQAIPEITKVLVGRDLTAGEFTFEIVSVVADNGDDDSWELTKTKAKNNADGKVSFGNITFTKPGTYIVTIKEAKGEDESITYDDHEIVVTYTVGYIGSENDGTYRLAVTKTEIDGETTFKNIYSNGSLSITKNVVGSVINNDEQFDINVTFEVDGDSEAKPLIGEYSYSITNADGTVANSGKVTLTDGSYTFHLKHGQTVKIEGLPLGTKYAVSEDTSADGFRYIASYENETGTITEDNSDVFVKVCNTMSYELPATGGTGSTKYLITGCIMLLAALSVLTIKRLRLINGF